MKKVIFVLFVVFFLTSCEMLPITEEQVESISKTAGNIVTTVTKPLIDPYVIGGSATAGGVATWLIAWILNALKKKGAEKRKEEIVSIIKESIER